MRLSPLPFLALLIIALTTGQAKPVFAGDVLSSGKFEGRSRHATTGGVTVRKSGTGAVVVLETDFSLDGAPDPKVGFGRDGKYDAAAKLDALKSNAGRQEYAVPAGIDSSRYNEVYIWCEKFNVPLGVARLK